MQFGNIIVIVAIVAILGLACLYIYREKKKGKKCIGCSCAGTSACHCGKEK